MLHYNYQSYSPSYPAYPSLLLLSRYNNARFSRLDVPDWEFRPKPGQPSRVDPSGMISRNRSVVRIKTRAGGPSPGKRLVEKFIIPERPVRTERVLARSTRLGADSQTVAKSVREVSTGAAISESVGLGANGSPPGESTLDETVEKSAPPIAENDDNVTISRKPSRGDLESVVAARKTHLEPSDRERNSTTDSDQSEATEKKLKPIKSKNLGKKSRNENFPPDKTQERTNLCVNVSCRYSDEKLEENVRPELPEFTTKAPPGVKKVRPVKIVAPEIRNDPFSQSANNSKCVSDAKVKAGATDNAKCIEAKREPINSVATIRSPSIGESEKSCILLVADSPCELGSIVESEEQPVEKVKNSKNVDVITINKEKKGKVKKAIKIETNEGEVDFQQETQSDTFQTEAKRRASQTEKNETPTVGKYQSRSTTGGQDRIFTEKLTRSSNCDLLEENCAVSVNNANGNLQGLLKKSTDPAKRIYPADNKEKVIPEHNPLVSTPKTLQLGVSSTAKDITQLSIECPRDSSLDSKKPGGALAKVDNKGPEKFQKTDSPAGSSEESFTTPSSISDDTCVTKDSREESKSKQAESTDAEKKSVLLVKKEKVIPKQNLLVSTPKTLQLGDSSEAKVDTPLLTKCPRDSKACAENKPLEDSSEDCKHAEVSINGKLSLSPGKVLGKRNIESVKPSYTREKTNGKGLQALKPPAPAVPEVKSSAVSTSLTEPREESAGKNFRSEQGGKSTQDSKEVPPKDLKVSAKEESPAATIPSNGKQLKNDLALIVSDPSSKGEEKTAKKVKKIVKKKADKEYKSEDAKKRLSLRHLDDLGELYEEYHIVGDDISVDDLAPGWEIIDVLIKMEGVKKKKKVIVKKKGSKVKKIPLEAKPPKSASETALPGDIYRQLSKKRVSLADEDLNLVGFNPDKRVSITDQVLVEEAALFDKMISKELRDARKSSLAFPPISESSDGELEEIAAKSKLAKTPTPKSVAPSPQERRELWKKNALRKSIKTLGGFYKPQAREESSSSSGSEEECDVNCHQKCVELMPNLCGVNQKLMVEALLSLKRVRRYARVGNSRPSIFKLDSEGEDGQADGESDSPIAPPAKTLPRFRTYTITDFQFLKVLGKGSFGKVLLAELKDTRCYYAVKCLKKDVVLEDDDVECTMIERKVLALGTGHPYFCHLFCTFQTESHLFFVMEYLNGGDLMFHIQQSGRFDEGRARFYAAEIVSALTFLHKLGIVYRDLKLDNVLLDFDGHVRIADFGMCKLQIYLDKTTDTFCGTPDYMAPEIIKGLKYNQCVDWWSFGILLYEMLVGQSPFSGCDEDHLFWSICNERPHMPRHLSQPAIAILRELLEKDWTKRLGSSEFGSQDVMNHRFFDGMKWHMLERRQIDPPYKPTTKHPLDTKYFDRAFTSEKPILTPVDKSILDSMDQSQFEGFSYTNPNVTE